MNRLSSESRSDRDRSRRRKRTPSPGKRQQHHSEKRRKKDRKGRGGRASAGSKDDDGGGSSGTEDLMDLEKELYPIGHYIDDREEMLNQVFKVLKGTKLKAMLTSGLRNVDVYELKALCLVQLEGMSKKRILSILEGKDMDESSATETEEDDDEEGESKQGCPKNAAAAKKSPLPESEKELQTLFKTAETALKSAAPGDPLSESKKVSGSIAQEIDSERLGGDLDKVTNRRLGSRTAKPKMTSGSKSGHDKRSTSTKADEARSKKLVSSGGGGGGPPAAPEQGKTLMEILELEMRARAIKSLLGNQELLHPAPAPADVGPPPQVVEKDDQEQEQEEQQLCELPDRPEADETQGESSGNAGVSKEIEVPEQEVNGRVKDLEGRKKLQKAKEALHLSEVKKREEQAELDRKQEEIRARLDQELRDKADQEDQERKRAEAKVKEDEENRKFLQWREERRKRKAEEDEARRRSAEASKAQSQRSALSSRDVAGTKRRALSGDEDGGGGGSAEAVIKRKKIDREDVEDDLDCVDFVVSFDYGEDDDPATTQQVAVKAEGQTSSGSNQEQHHQPERRRHERRKYRRKREDEEGEIQDHHEVQEDDEDHGDGDGSDEEEASLTLSSMSSFDSSGGSGSSSSAFSDQEDADEHRVERAREDRKRRVQEIRRRARRRKRASDIEDGEVDSDGEHFEPLHEDDGRPRLPGVPEEERDLQAKETSDDAAETRVSADIPELAKDEDEALGQLSASNEDDGESKGEHASDFDGKVISEVDRSETGGQEKMTSSGSGFEGKDCGDQMPSLVNDPGEESAVIEDDKGGPDAQRVDVEDERMGSVLEDEAKVGADLQKRSQQVHAEPGESQGPVQSERIETALEDEAKVGTDSQKLSHHVHAGPDESQGLVQSESIETFLEDEAKVGSDLQKHQMNAEPSESLRLGQSGKTEQTVREGGMTGWGDMGSLDLKAMDQREKRLKRMQAFQARSGMQELSLGDSSDEEQGEDNGPEVATKLADDGQEARPGTSENIFYRSYNRLEDQERQKLDEDRRRHPGAAPAAPPVPTGEADDGATGSAAEVPPEPARKKWFKDSRQEKTTEEMALSGVGYWAKVCQFHDEFGGGDSQQAASSTKPSSQPPVANKDLPSKDQVDAEQEAAEDAADLTWADRWYKNKRVQKVVKDSKMLSKVRTNIKIKLKETSETSATPEEQSAAGPSGHPKVAELPNVVVGSLEDYAKLVGKTVEQVNEEQEKGRDDFDDDEDDDDDETSQLWGAIMGK